MVINLQDDQFKDIDKKYMKQLFQKHHLYANKDPIIWDEIIITGHQYNLNMFENHYY